MTDTSNRRQAREVRDADVAAEIDADDIEDHEAAGIARPESEDRPEHEDLTPEKAFRRTVEDGRRRINRPLPAMFATGFVGGMDIGTGILGLLLVEQATGSPLIGGLAFSIAFIALLLARSELFTEGFLVPVSAVVARKAKVWGVLRLWAVTIVANLIGGWIITWVLMIAFPQLHPIALHDGEHFVNLGFGAQSFMLAVLAGVAITLMTWMQNSSEQLTGKLAAAVSVAWLLAGGQLFHSILDSLLMFCALHTGHAPFGYLQWFERFCWAALGNTIGGVGLVTALRLMQVPHRVALERAHPEV